MAANHATNGRVKRARQLWYEVDGAVLPYPQGVAPVPEPIRGTAFFPGGLGLWLGRGDAPIRLPRAQALIVGQDFNSAAAYERAFELGTEIDTSATWRNLRPILATAKLPLEACVFTNFYMGLREIGPETGSFPGAKDAAFKNRCASFFRRQLDVWQPKLILTLGLPAMRAVGAVCNLLTPGSLQDCEHIYPGVSLQHGAVTIVALTHPSYYAANVGRRRYKDLAGSEAEQSMMTDALVTSGIWDSDYS
jgi:hypothetical protein